MCWGGGGGRVGGTAIYGLYRYVPRDPTGYGMVFEVTYLLNPLRS